MKRKLFLIGVGIGLQHMVFASSIETTLQEKSSFNWIFSGMVTNEQAVRYGYYFEIQKKDAHVRVLSALINLEQKTLVFVDEDEATVPESSGLKWQVGRSYFGFNPMTHRLMFGVKTAENQGLGFYVDTLDEPLSTTKPQILRAGLALNVIQMGRLTGHVYLGGDQDEFVSAKQTWFRQLSGKSMVQTDASHQATGVLCQFDDGSGFYAMNVPEADALRGFVAGWRDATGKALKMSQFVKITEDIPHEWDLSIPLPSMHVHFSDLLAKGQIAAGVVQGKYSGFCTAEKEQV